MELLARVRIKHLQESYADMPLLHVKGLETRCKAGTHHTVSVSTKSMHSFQHVQWHSAAVAAWTSEVANPISLPPKNTIPRPYC